MLSDGVHPARPVRVVEDLVDFEDDRLEWKPITFIACFHSRLRYEFS